jgi:hypothetical protein
VDLPETGDVTPGVFGGMTAVRKIFDDEFVVVNSAG